MLRIEHARQYFERLKRAAEDRHKQLEGAVHILLNCYVEEILNF